MRMVEFRVKGYDSLSREVRGGGRPSAVIHVPKSWAGKKVLVILLEPPTSPDAPA